MPRIYTVKSPAATYQTAGDTINLSGAQDFFNVRDFGAKGNGTDDDTVPISDAILAASHKGGTVYLPQGTYVVSSPVILYSLVHLRGAGNEATIITLATSANCDVLQGLNAPSLVNPWASNATGSTGGINAWSVSDITIDGNKANQSGTSYGLDVYGLNFRLHNIEIRNCLSGGILADWNGGGSVNANPSKDMAAFVSNFKIHDNGGVGILWGGPHDSQFTNGLSYKNDSHGMYIGPNASAIVMEQFHPWGSKTGVNAVGLLTDAGYGQYSNCIFEGSDVVQVVVNGGSTNFAGCHFFGTPGGSGYVTSGLQIGQASGQTPFPYSNFQTVPGATSGGSTTSQGVGGLRFTGSFDHCEGANGALIFANDTGACFIEAEFFLQAGKLFSGTINATTHFYCIVNGLTPDGTLAQSGGVQIPINASAALKVTNKTTDYFVVNTFSQFLQLPNGMKVRGYSDNYSTITYQLINGTLCLGQSATAPAITNNNTITTNNVGEARVAPAGNVTGIILQAGTQPGQACEVVNESAFTVTFDVSGTSHVADGVSAVIAANRKMSFTWDSGTSLWYHS